MPSLEDLSIDQLLARAKHTEQSDALVRALAANPQTRTGLQRLIKQHNPKTIIPELDAADAVRGEVAGANERIAALENAFLENGVRDRLTRQRGDIQAKYGFTDADMNALESMMTDPDPEKRIPGYETAARVYKAERQPSIPTTSAVARPGLAMPSVDIWGSAIGNRDVLNRTAMDLAFQASNEFRQGGGVPH